MQSANQYHPSSPFATSDVHDAFALLLHWCRANIFMSLLATLAFATSIHAQTPQLRLGNPVVLSALGSPLWVRIPIETPDTDMDVAAARFSLGLRPPNAPVPFVERAEIGMERQGNNYSLVIRSRNSIDEPAIGIVLREELPNGVRSREFFLLLDPAPLMPVATAGPEQNRAPSPDAAPTATTLPALPAPPTVVVPVPAVSAIVSPPKKIRRARSTRILAAPEAQSIRPAVAAGGSESISPIAQQRGATQSRPPSSPGAVEGGPRLKLSYGEGLTTRPATTEAERAELRMRQFTLDMDDLTSGLLERQHKISQLEKELVSLAARVTAAERVIGATAPAIAAAPVSSPAIRPGVDASTTPLVGTAPTVTAPAAPATRPPVATPTASSAIPTNAAASGARGTRPWSWWLVGAALLAALVAAVWGIRSVMRRRDGAYRITAQRAEEYVAEVMSHQPSKATATGDELSVSDAPAISAARLATPGLAVTPNEHPAPEIHFELPELAHAADATGDPAPTRNEASHAAVTKIVRKSVDDTSSRRMRYLQSRYHDIAILMPPLDAPQRLLRQAATVYDEGASEFAKRLLKFAAYSRPYTEEFWLALLELLYREKFATDYVVNAKWFHEYHPDSKDWDEAVRIGYLLDPLEPLFAIASHWPHDEPLPGLWLPSDPGEQKPLAPPPHLKLELAK